MTNDDVLVKGTYFASTTAGSHNVAFGYDTFNDKRFANNHQSGSDYRIYGTTSILQSGVIYPVFDTGSSTYIPYDPIIQATTRHELPDASGTASDGFGGLFDLKSGIASARAGFTRSTTGNNCLPA